MTLTPRQKRMKLLRVHAREGGRCFYCGVHVNLHTVESLATRWPDPRAATLDHIVPRSRGGGNTDGNVVLACRGCNERRSDMPAADFLALQQQAVQA